MWGGARACRVCLAGAGAGAALLPAPRAARLLRAYEQAAGLPFQEECGMPRQLCYVCAALLAKFSIFRKKCRRSHFLLRAIYDAHDEITDEEIAKIDREASKLTSQYVIDILEPFGFDPLQTDNMTIVKDEVNFEQLPTDEVNFDPLPIVEMPIVKGEMNFEQLPTDEVNFDPLPIVEMPIVKEKMNLEQLPTDEVNFDPLSIVGMPIAKDEMNFEQLLADEVNLEPLTNVKTTIIRDKVNFDPLPTVEMTILKEKVNLDPLPIDEMTIVKNEVNFDPFRTNEMTAVKDKDVPKIHEPDDASMKDEQVKQDKEKEKEAVEENIVTEGTVPGVQIPLRKERRRGIGKEYTSFYLKYVTITNLTREQQLEDVLKRQETSNYKNSPLKCTLCFKGFLQESTYKNHMVSHDSTSGMFECTICWRRFKSAHSLSKHVGATHTRRYACKQCQHVCTSSSRARIHEKWHKGTSYKCPHCDNSFLKSTSYLSHIRTKHPSQFICEMCGNAFVSEKGIVRHKKLTHRDELPSTQGPLCSECDIRFASDDAYKKHLLTSAKHNLTSDCLYACDECGQTFEQRTELRNHMRDEHGRAPRAPCPQQRRLPRKQPVNNHYPRKCDQCSLEVTSGRDYWMHFRRAHKGQHYPKQAGKFICDLCGKGFQVKTLLVYHLRQHSGEKPYKCTVCNRAFMMNTYLVRHMYMHTGDRPFVCGVCGRGFPTKANLGKHIMLHTGNLKYPCEYCKRMFRMPSEVKTHIKHAHMKVR